MVEPSVDLQLVFEKAIKDAQKLSHEYVTLEHILYAMMCEEKFVKLIEGYGSDVANIKLAIESHLKNDCSDIKTDIKKYKPKKTQTVERVLNRAFTQVLFIGRNNIQLTDILLSMLSEKHSIATFHLEKSGISKDKFLEYLQDSTDTDLDEKPKAAMPNDLQKALKQFTTNLNEQVKQKKIDPIVGRNKELESLSLVLGRRNKNNILMVGDPGVGKTAIMEGLAFKIVNNDVPDFLKEYQVYSLDIAAMLAGSKYRGDFEERFKMVLAALIKQGKAIMFVDEAHMMSGAGAGSGNNPNDLANMLKPALTKGDLKVVASTTWEEYRKFFEKDRALMRRFQRVTVDEPDAATTKEILKGIKKYYEDFHNTTITDDAVDAAVKLSIRYQNDKKLPDKAIDLLDVACARFKLMSLDKDFKKIVDTAQVQFELAKMLGVDVSTIAEKETSNLANLEKNLKNVVFGQDEAIEKVVDKILVAQAGLKPDNKPIGSFVFMGPTGTGKTETCKQLATALGIKLVRFDMSEYQEKHSVSKLIGSPPGYVGFEDSAGQLITKLQEHPNCVLLLDEIEKAHPDVSTILLQLMDNGKVTGSNGKEADARNCILVLTTNLGARSAEKNKIGFTDTNTNTYEDTEFKKFFSPEFRNRLDATVTFAKLSKETMMKIVGKFLVELKNMIMDKNIDLSISDEALDYLVETGFDPKNGARPLQRVIDKEIKSPLSRMMLFGDLKNGGSAKIDFVNGELIIKKVETVANEIH
jgi:ATP-dependent Clp protease ATP-binding subunit ClpA